MRFVAPGTRIRIRLFAGATLSVLLCLAPAAWVREAAPDEPLTPGFDEGRRPKDDADLHRWLENMLVYHRFSSAEISAATGLSAAEIDAALNRFSISPDRQPIHAAGRLTVLPYPGGRHPRIGFRDGAIRPQRETKVSVFAPWSGGGYVVVDVPEAISTSLPEGRELLYLAHTHVPTLWTRQGIKLEPLEWQPGDDGSLHAARRLPNGAEFAASVESSAGAVLMELQFSNGTSRTLTGLRVQNCVLLGSATGFSSLTTGNKIFADPFVACRDATGKRWIITAWEKCGRTWGNRNCPCMHSDPQFPDCAPGETQRLRGWLSFYEGDDIEAEFRRIEDSVKALAWSLR